MYYKVDRKYLTFLIDCFVSVMNIFCRGWFYNPNQNFISSLSLKEFCKLTQRKIFSFTWELFFSISQVFLQHMVNLLVIQ